MNIKNISNNNCDCETFWLLKTGWQFFMNSLLLKRILQIFHLAKCINVKVFRVSSYCIFVLLLIPQLVFAQNIQFDRDDYSFDKRDYLEIFELNGSLPIINENVGLNEVFLKIPIRYKKVINLNMPLQVKVGDKYGKIIAKNQRGIYYGNYFEFEENGAIKFFAKGATNFPDTKNARSQVDIWFFAGDEDGLRNFCILDYKTIQKLINCGKFPAFVDELTLEKGTQIIQLLNFEYKLADSDNEVHYFNFSIKKFSQNKKFKMPTHTQMINNYLLVSHDNPATYLFVVRNDLSFDLFGKGVLIEQYIDDKLIRSFAQGKFKHGLISFSEQNVNVSIEALKNGKFAIKKIQ